MKSIINVFLLFAVTSVTYGAQEEQYGSDEECLFEISSFPLPEESQKNMLELNGEKESLILIPTRYMKMSAILTQRIEDDSESQDKTKGFCGEESKEYKHVLSVSHNQSELDLLKALFHLSYNIKSGYDTKNYEGFFQQQSAVKRGTIEAMIESYDIEYALRYLQQKGILY